MIVIALMSVPTATFAHLNKDERDLGKGSAMLGVELHGEPMTFELDVSHADTGNPRHRPDPCLPKNRKSNRLPAIVFSHGRESTKEAGGKSVARTSPSPKKSV